jgi:hypothetical protein
MDVQGTHHPGMRKKRILAAVLWFVVGWQAGGLLVSIVGLPSMLGFAPGVALALVVLWDPAHLFRPRIGPERRVTEINAYAERLDKRVDHWPAVETDRRA